jgi:hydroxylaminobenzene mutase
MRTEETARRLVWHGMLLFLLGLLTGLAEPQFKGLRMALAAHLEGVINGIFLIAIGAVWDKLRFSARQSAAAYWTALYGTYGNWAATVLAAVFGTAALSPVTSAGQHGQPWQEHLITIVFISVGVAIITCAVVVLVAARQPAPPQVSPHAAERAS